MGAFWKRIAAVLRLRRLDGELSEEIEAHLALQEQEFRRAGMSASDARAAALREFGGVARTEEIYRERRGLPWLETAAKDVQYALRGLRRQKGFTAAALVSLALGIGANTAIFSLYQALMLRMLPVSHPEELVSFNRSGGWGSGGCAYPYYLEVAKRTDLFQGVVARSVVEKVRLNAGGDRLESTQREFVTGNYFEVLGVRPALGRLLTAVDDVTAHAHPLAVLSYEYWQTRFGADPAIVGRQLIVDEQPLTVIGVAARGFRGVEVDHRPDLWEPVTMMRADPMDGRTWAWVVGRRQRGVATRQIQAAASVMLQQFLTGVYGNHPNATFRRIAMGQQVEVRDAAEGISYLRDQFGKPLLVLLCAVALVLLAACANVANLLLARGAARQKEMALRVSLGATRGRLIAQALTESLILAMGGAALGIGLAFWGTAAILRFLPASGTNSFTTSPDAAALLFTLAVAVVAAMLFGLVPAIRTTTARDVAAAKPVVRRVLVTAQVAFSVVLVALAGLFAHSMSSLRGVDLGFRNQDVVAFSLDFPQSWKKEESKAVRERFLAQMEALPGVTTVTTSFPGPFLGGSSNATVSVAGSETSWVNLHSVGPRYFETLGATIVAGREIDRTDTGKSRHVAVVNEAFVRKYLAGEKQVLDRVLSMGEGPTYIVGVVKDIEHDGLRRPAVPVVYAPMPQVQAFLDPVILVRSSMPSEALLPAIRRELARVSPLMGTTEPRTIRRRVDDSIFQDRLLATLGGFFGGLALLLAAVGLYGVISYGTARRAREIGIRIALGARRPAVLWMVLRDAMLLVTAGLLVGLPASYAAARQVASLLFGVRPGDGITFAATAAALAAAGIAAAFIPARRAARVDPMRVLRAD